MNHGKMRNYDLKTKSRQTIKVEGGEKEIENDSLLYKKNNYNHNNNNNSTYYHLSFIIIITKYLHSSYDSAIGLYY